MVSISKLIRQLFIPILKYANARVCCMAAKPVPYLLSQRND